MQSSCVKYSSLTTLHPTVHKLKAAHEYLERADIDSQEKSNVTQFQVQLGLE